MFCHDFTRTGEHSVTKRLYAFAGLLHVVQDDSLMIYLKPVQVWLRTDVRLQANTHSTSDKCCVRGMLAWGVHFNVVCLVFGEECAPGFLT